jgi:hypothetical protein
MIVVRKGDVLSSLKVLTAGIALSVALFLATAASAGPKEDVAAATLKWAQVIGEGDTLSPTVRADRAALRDYFVGAFKVLPGLKVAYGDQLIRVYDNAAVNTGYSLSLSLRMERPRPCLRATALRT